MVDMSQLLAAMRDYESALNRHQNEVAAAYREVDNAYGRLRGSFDGTAARDFENHWSRTRRSFQRYTEGTRQLGVLLNKRVEHLADADRPGRL